MRPAIGAVIFISAALVSLGLVNPPDTGVSRSVAAVAPQTTIAPAPALVPKFEPTPLPASAPAQAAPAQVAIPDSKATPVNTTVSAIPPVPPVVVIARVPETAAAPSNAPPAVAAAATAAIATVGGITGSSAGGVATPDRNVATSTTNRRPQTAKTAGPARKNTAKQVISPVTPKPNRVAASKPPAVKPAAVAPSKRAAVAAVVERRKR